MVRVMVKKKKKGLLLPWKEVIKMWDDVYDEYLNRNSPERAVAIPNALYSDSNFKYSGLSMASAYYIVEEFPPEMELGYRKTFRSVAPHGVSINFIEYNELFNINWSDPAFKTRMSILDNVDQEKQEERQNASAFTSHQYHKEEERDKRLKQSLSYIETVDLSTDNVRKLTKIRVLVIITGTRNSDFSTCLKDFESLCNSRTGLKVSRVVGTINQVIKAFSPFSDDWLEAEKKRYPSTLSSDELRARWHPYEHGVVGYGNIYLGTNIDTNSPVFKTFKRNSTDAEIVFVLGMTDAGKSYLMKTIVTQLAGEKEYVMTINDYEGGEYNMLGKLVSEEGTVVELDFSKGSGRYYDPVPLYATGEDKIDSQLLGIARENIINLFRAVAGESTLSKREWVSVIIENGLDKFYNDLGVTDDTHTWFKTIDKSIYDVYESMLKYTPTTDEDSEGFASDRSYFIEKFAPYLDKERKVNKYFTEPVHLGDIRDADLVICNYNMRAVSEEQLSELDSILIPLNASIISYYRTIFPYSEGKYNVKVWEELQRFKKLKNAVTLLKTPLSGGRKMGDVNIVGSNDPAELLKEDDFNLFGSYTMALVGRVPSPTIREKICTELGLGSLRDELDAIGDVVAEDDGSGEVYDEIAMNPYKKAFVARLDTGESVVLKVDLPKWLSETPLFKTGVDKKEV